MFFTNKQQLWPTRLEFGTSIMAQLVTCDACNGQFTLNEQVAGSVALCPTCQSKVTVRDGRGTERDVIVCCSSKDKKTADAVVAALESGQVSCWVSTRDVPPDSTWETAFSRVVKTTRVMVLILSRNSDRTRQVVREVNHALENGLAIIPFRVEKFPLSAEMGHMLASTLWLDAAGTTLGAAINDLVQLILTVKNSKLTAPSCLVNRRRTTLRRAVAQLLPLACGLAVGAITGWWLSVPTTLARTKAVAALIDNTGLLNNGVTGENGVELPDGKAGFGGGFFKNGVAGEDAGHVSALDGALVVNARFDHHLAIRSFLDSLAAAKGASLPPPEWGANSADMAKFRATLLKPTNVEFLDLALEDCISYLQAYHGINIVLDKQTLTDYGVALDQPITLKLSSVALHAVLALLLDPVGAEYYLSEAGIVITAALPGLQHGLIATYDIRPLCK